MKTTKKILEFKEKIKNTKTKRLAEVAQISYDMALKYKSLDNYPPLKRAVLIEDKLGIPARAWIDIRKEDENVFNE